MGLNQRLPPHIQHRLVPSLRGRRRIQGREALRPLLLPNSSDSSGNGDNSDNSSGNGDNSDNSSGNGDDSYNQQQQQSHANT